MRNIYSFSLNIKNNWLPDDDREYIEKLRRNVKL